MSGRVPAQLRLHYGIQVVFPGDLEHFTVAVDHYVMDRRIPPQSSVPGAPQPFIEGAYLNDGQTTKNTDASPVHGWVTPAQTTYPGQLPQSAALPSAADPSDPPYVPPQPNNQHPHQADNDSASHWQQPSQVAQLQPHAMSTTTYATHPQQYDGTYPPGQIVAQTIAAPDQTAHAPGLYGTATHGTVPPGTGAYGALPSSDATAQWQPTTPHNVPDQNTTDYRTGPPAGHYSAPTSPTHYSPHVGNQVLPASNYSTGQPYGTTTPQATIIPGNVTPAPAPMASQIQQGDYQVPRRPTLGSFSAAAWYGFRKNAHVLAGIMVVFLGSYVALATFQAVILKTMPDSLALPIATGITGSAVLCLGAVAFLKACLDIAHTGKAGLFSSFQGYSRLRAGLLLVSYITLMGLAIAAPLVGTVTVGASLMLLLPAYLHRQGSFGDAFRDCLNITIKQPFGFVLLWLATALVAKIALVVIYIGLIVVTVLNGQNSQSATLFVAVLFPILAFPIVSLLSIGTCHTYLFATYQHCDYPRSQAA